MSKINFFIFQISKCTHFSTIKVMGEKCLAPKMKTQQLFKFYPIHPYCNKKRHSPDSYVVSYREVDRGGLWPPNIFAPPCSKVRESCFRAQILPKFGGICQKSKTNCGKKAQPRNFFFGPFNLKILPTSLVSQFGMCSMHSSLTFLTSLCLSNKYLDIILYILFIQWHRYTWLQVIVSFFTHEKTTTFLIKISVQDITIHMILSPFFYMCREQIVLTIFKQLVSTE